MSIFQALFGGGLILLVLVALAVYGIVALVRALTRKPTSHPD